MAAARPALPSTIAVGPFRYRVSTNKAERREVEAEQRSLVNGHSDHDLLVIVVDAELAADVVAETTVHEVLHALTYLAGLSTAWGADKEEDVVRRLAPLLLDTLRRNPDLVAFVMADA